MRKKGIRLLLALTVMLAVMVFTPTSATAIEFVSMRDDMQPSEIEATLEDENEVINSCQERVDELKALGIEPYLLENILIKIYPAVTLPNGLRGGYVAKDTIYETGVLGEIAVTQYVMHLGVFPNSPHTFFHELGHIIHDKKFNVDGYDWACVNEVGQQYIQLVNYDKKLDYASQIELPWHERIAEHFAEDIYVFLTEKTGRVPFWTYGDSIEVNKFLDELIFCNEAVVEDGTGLGAIICEYATQFLGTPYRYGGSSPGGFDSAGFVYYVFKQCGYSLPRTAAAIYGVGVHVDKSNLRPGDLVFFKGPGTSCINHVGIYVANNQFIHSSSGRVYGVAYSSLDGPYYCQYYAGAKRILPIIE